jgi:hypothetical protein
MGLSRNYNNSRVDDDQYQQEFAEGFRDAKNHRTRRRFPPAGYVEGYNAFLEDQSPTWIPSLQIKKKPRRNRNRRPKRNKPYYSQERQSDDSST